MRIIYDILFNKINSQPTIQSYKCQLVPTYENIYDKNTYRVTRYTVLIHCFKINLMFRFSQRLR